MIGTIGVCFFPESPKYLIKTGQIDRAQEVFYKIAQMNKADPTLVAKERFHALFGEKSKSQEDIMNEQSNK